MPVKSYKMGPGTLTLGEAGAQDASCQLTACTIAPSENVETTDPIAVLCGEELTVEDEVTLEWTISGNVLQDLDAAGIVTYTWDNASAVVDFKFVPNTAAARQVTGQCRLIPLAIGGEVKSNPQSDFEWKVIGTPTLAPLAA